MDRFRSDFLRYENSAGEFIDFHALRHTYITAITSGGATVPVAKALARHTTSRLTMDFYSHPQLYDVTGALDALPSAVGEDEPPSENEARAGQLRATGTDHHRSEDAQGAQRRAQQSRRDIVRIDATEREGAPDEGAHEKPPKPRLHTDLGGTVRNPAKRRRADSNRRCRICNPMP